MFLCSPFICLPVSPAEVLGSSHFPYTINQRNPGKKNNNTWEHNNKKAADWKTRGRGQERVVVQVDFVIFFVYI